MHVCGALTFGVYESADEVHYPLPETIRVLKPPPTNFCGTGLPKHFRAIVALIACLLLSLLLFNVRKALLSMRLII